jgi:hypothetical protein
MPIDLKQSINNALDITYKSTAAQMLAKIDRLTNAPTASIQIALRDLDDEVSRLEEIGEPLAKDNAHLLKVLALLDMSFNAAGDLIDKNATRIQESGIIIAPVAVTAKVFSQLTKTTGNPVAPDKLAGYIKALDKLGVDWTAPTSLDFARGYTELPAWNARMSKWGTGYGDLIKDTVLNGISEGWGPKFTAGKLRQYVETMPKYAAENLTRTLQINSYRQASLAMEQLNGSFIEYKIRIADLNGNVCLACIALHGTRLEKGESVDDHYNGHCDFYIVTYGGPRTPEFMQSDSTPGNRNYIPFTDGNTWFSNLSPERQAQQASFANSPAKFRAFQAGTPLSQFVGEHQDSIFGTQVVEKSLVGALGDNASQYYTKNQIE